ncbi:MAG TPA: HAD family hydrolase [Phycisphaerae bacterium]|nr:HAD family hydrolase [Phycisphaerae bacterium]
MSVKVVAFDVYDTLARWPVGRVQPIEVQRLLGRFGIEISYQSFEAARQAVFFFDSPKREIVGWTDYLALVFARMGVMVPLDLLTCVAAEYESRNNMEILPGALEAIEGAKRAGKVTCAFTTLPKFMIGLRKHELLSRLDHYFDASATGFGKGHPAFYRRIAEMLGVAPNEILAVGDDPICDVELPREAGWRAVLLSRDGSQSNDKITLSLKALSELPTYYSS